jgi:peptide/nickel transport system substrate-binding protein
MTSSKFTRRSVLQTSAALGVAGAVLPGAAAHAQSAAPKIRVTSDIQHLDPFDQIGGAEETVKAATLVTLIRFKQQGSTDWEPYAAKSVDVVDDTTVAFTLRDDIQWTGGYGPLTAHDVKFSFERMADPDAGSPWQYAWDLLDNVEVVDDLNGVIHMKEPFAPLFYTSLPWYAGQIVCKKAVEEAGGTFTTEFPAECGPYLMTGWEPKIKLTLSRNADWVVDHPDFDGFELITISDDKAAEIAFEAGELDFTLISPDSIAHYRENPVEGAKLLELPSINYSWIGMNVDNPKLEDVRVRQAIQYAIDVDQVMAGAYAGSAEPSTGIQAPGTVGYREKRLIEGVDLDKARALLAEAGVADGLDLTLTTLNDTVSLTVCQIVQANLAEVGINVEIVPYDPGVYWNLGLESEGEDWKNLELTLMSYGGGIDPSENLIWFTPEQVGVWNWERWNNAEFGELYEQGNVELDAEKRNVIYQRMQDLMEESGAYVFLTHGALAALYRDWMEPFVRYDRTLALPQFRKV